MKLLYSTNSPFARKCRIVAIEKGLENDVELINVNPMENSEELLAVNPLGTVPAFVTNEGLHLCGSGEICEYLDMRPSKAKPLLPPVESRECVLAFVAMAEGIMEAAVCCVLEERRPEEKQYKAWVERKEAAIMRTIAKFSYIPMEKTPLSLGLINLAVALDYVSFRLPHLVWREAHPELAAWLDEFSTRKSFVDTQPAI